MGVIELEDCCLISKWFLFCSRVLLIGVGGLLFRTPRLVRGVVVI